MYLVKVGGMIGGWRIQNILLPWFVALELYLKLLQEEKVHLCSTALLMHNVTPCIFSYI